MSKYLVIAEKPSVANDIAKALGGFEKKKDYFEGEEYVISSAVGHLLEIAAPEEYEVKRGKWSFAHLPVLPPYFDLKVIERTKSRLDLLVKLIKRKDIVGLINACDAGREGELIFRYIYQYSKTNKPIQRLWLRSMTQQAIRDGFQHLRSESAVHQLAEAARCRSEADWLVGINGTRAMTAFNSKSGGFQLTTVGRVQTPTLTILVDREEKIRSFVPKPYWNLDAEFEYEGERYTGHWFDEHFERQPGTENADQRADRLWTDQRALEILSRDIGCPGIITEESKPLTQLSPLLYDLTSLQREANTRFGFSAKTTLSAAQALYERHKVLTYPRTDSRALPEDYIGTTKAILSHMADDKQYGTFANDILKQNWVKPSPRIFNNKKISDHFAIIPTQTVPKTLSEVESKIYDMVVRRFLAVFHPAAEYRVTTRITRVGQDAFKTEGKVLVSPGWLSVYGRAATAEDDQLIALPADAVVNTPTMQLYAKETRPPARFTEATLLSAMEGAGKLVEDEELRAAMSAKGLGTPATRAAIIEGLIDEKYVLRQDKALIPTAKAFSLLTLLRGLDVAELCSPELTGHWEHDLALIEKGEKERADFMEEIRQVTQKIVEQAKNYDSDTVPGEFATLSVPCPKCGGVIKETYKKFLCSDCHYGFWKIVAGRQMEPQEIDQLLTEREIGPLEGFRSKMGRLFAAKIRLNDEDMPEFDFGNPADNPAEPIDFSDKASIGKCPACEPGQIYEHGTAYICDQIQHPDHPCKFRLSQTILQKMIDEEQAKKLLTQGKTDLIKGFISKRGKPFSAYLVLGEGGKIGFEFEAKAPPRKPKAASAKSTSAKATPAATKAPRKTATRTKKVKAETETPEENQ